MVLVLFETAVGYCLFSLSDEGKVNSPDLYKSFESESEANRLLQLSAIHRFQSTVEAVEGATAINEGKLSKDLKKFLQREILEKGGSAGAKGASTEKLLVSEPKLGTLLSRSHSVGHNEEARHPGRVRLESDGPVPWHSREPRFSPGQRRLGRGFARPARPEHHVARSGPQPESLQAQVQPR